MDVDERGKACGWEDVMMIGGHRIPTQYGTFTDVAVRTTATAV